MRFSRNIHLPQSQNNCMKVSSLIGNLVTRCEVRLGDVRPSWARQMFRVDRPYTYLPLILGMVAPCTWLWIPISAGLLLRVNCPITSPLTRPSYPPSFSPLPTSTYNNATQTTLKSPCLLLSGTLTHPPHGWPSDMRGELYILSAEEQFLSTKCRCHLVLWHTGSQRIIILFIISNFIYLLLLTLRKQKFNLF